MLLSGTEMVNQTSGSTLGLFSSFRCPPALTGCSHFKLSVITNVRVSRALEYLSGAGWSYTIYFAYLRIKTAASTYLCRLTTRGSSESQRPVWTITVILFPREQPVTLSAVLVGWFSASFSLSATLARCLLSCCSLVSRFGLAVRR